MRIPVSSQKNRRVEHRVAGADANPYLVTAAIMSGIHHGITNLCDPGPMTQEEEILEFKSTLPIRWFQALDTFQSGKILPEYFGKEYHRVFGVCRHEEADMFHSEVSFKDYQWFMRSL
jgi:glutamine synthetase